MGRLFLLVALVAVGTNAFPEPSGGLNEEGEELMRQATQCINPGDPQRKLVDISPDDLFHQAMRFKDQNGWLSTTVANVTTQKRPIITWKVDLAKMVGVPHNKTYWIEAGHRAGSCAMEVSMALMCATIKYCKKFDKMQMYPKSKVCRTRLYFVHQSNPDGYEYNLKQEDDKKTDFTTTNMQGKVGSCDGININQNFKQGFENIAAKCTGSAPYEAPEAKYLNGETEKTNPCGHFTVVENDDKFRFLAPWAFQDVAASDPSYRRRAHIMRTFFMMETGPYHKRVGKKTGTHMDTRYQDTLDNKRQFSQLFQCKKGYNRENIEKIIKGFVHVLASGVRRAGKENKEIYNEMANAKPSTEFSPEETKDAVDAILGGSYRGKFTVDESFPVTSQGYSFRVINADNTRNLNSKGTPKKRPLVSIFGGGLINVILDKYAAKRKYFFKMNWLSTYNPNNGYYSNKNGDEIDGQNCASAALQGYNILMGYKPNTISDRCDPAWSLENAAQETKNMRALIEDGKTKMAPGGGVFIIFTFMKGAPSTIHHTARSKAHADQLKSKLDPAIAGLAIKEGFDTITNIDAITQDVIVIRINYEDAGNKAFKDIADEFLAGLDAVFPKPN